MESKEHPTTTWPMREWSWEDSQRLLIPWGTRAVTCEVRNEKKCACVRRVRYCLYKGGREKKPPRRKGRSCASQQREGKQHIPTERREQTTTLKGGSGKKHHTKGGWESSTTDKRRGRKRQHPTGARTTTTLHDLNWPDFTFTLLEFDVICFYKKTPPPKGGRQISWRSIGHYNLVHILSPLPQAMKIPDAKAAVEKEWKNSRNYRHGSWRKSETIMRWSLWSKEWGQKSSLCVIDGSLSSQEFGVGTTIFRNTKVESYSEVTLWKMIQDRTQYLLSKDHQHHKWRLQK